MIDNKVRRVVTGHDADGKAVVVSDGPVPSIMIVPQRPGYSQQQVWITRQTPAPIHGEEDPTVGFNQLLPPKNGNVLRIVEVPPESSWIGEVDRARAKAAFAVMQAEDASTHDEDGPTR